MSYDFWLAIPGPARRRKKGAPSDAQVARLQRAKEILLRYEPDLAIDDDETMFTARSEQMGEVFVEHDCISLAGLSRRSARELYGALHGLMQRFDGEGYDAHDPQLDATVRYDPSFETFMQQYRGDFDCTDAEFSEWCQGRTPESWARRAAERARGAAIAAKVLPRREDIPWQELKAAPDKMLWSRLQHTIARNDAAIAAHGLGEYMRGCSIEARKISASATRRLDGSYFPNSIAVPWMDRSLLDSEARLLGELRHRRYPGCAMEQPQRMVLWFAMDLRAPTYYEHATRRSDLARRMLAAMQRVNSSVRSDGSGSDASLNQYYFEGDDVDAMFAALEPMLPEARQLRLVRATLRHGEFGAPETEHLFDPMPMTLEDEP